jgi:hypothetical protein
LIRREELNKLVVFTLEAMPTPPRASELYDVIRIANPHILKSERANTFRSFVQVIHQFEEILILPGEPCTYKVAKSKL